MSILLSSVFFKVLFSLFCGFIIFSLFSLVYLFFELIRRLSFSLTVLDGVLVDKKVDEICLKAVVITECNEAQEKLLKDKKERQKFESACAVVSDVLMQHGLRPKDYNLPALVSVARYKLGLYSPKKGGEKNG